MDSNGSPYVGHEDYTTPGSGTPTFLVVPDGSLVIEPCGHGPLASLQYWLWTRDRPRLDMLGNLVAECRYYLWWMAR